MTKPEIIAAAKTYFNDVQQKETKYIPLIAKDTPPAIWLNKETDDKFRAELKKL